MGCFRDRSPLWTGLWEWKAMAPFKERRARRGWSLRARAALRWMRPVAGSWGSIPLASRFYNWPPAQTHYRKIGSPRSANASLASLADSRFSRSSNIFGSAQADRLQFSIRLVRGSIRLTTPIRGYFVIVPQAMRSPALPAGSECMSSALAWISERRASDWRKRNERHRPG